MKYIIHFLLLFFLLSISIIFSQEKTSDSLHSYTVPLQISGYIFDEISNLPLAHVPIKLTRTDDSTVFISAETDSTGFFSLAALKPGRYILEASFTGYEKFSMDSLMVDTAQKTIEADTIFLKTKSHVTEEIEVEGEKGLFQFGPDKKIFNAEKSIVSKGENALDLLKRVPLVSVDNNDVVSLRGSANIKILINGKESVFFRNLKQMPADLIKTVELITNPSAKYESEGVSGIINIVLKDNAGFGINGNIYLGAGSKDKYFGSINLNLKKGGLTTFFNYNGGFYRYSYNAKSSRENLITPVSFLDQSSGGSSKSKYQYVSGGLEYEINDIHTLSLNASVVPGNNNGSDESEWTNLDSLRQKMSSSLRNSENNGTNLSYSMSFGYTASLDTNGREFDADISFNSMKSDYTSNQVNIKYDSLNNPEYFPLLQNDIRKTKNSNLNFKMDYFHPFSNQTSVETGLKALVRINDNDFESDTLNNSINQFQNNYSISNHFRLTEQVYSLYGLFGSKIKNFSFKLGVRLEYTSTKGELFTTGDIYKQNYLNVFPTLNLSYMLPGMQQIQLSYSRRINRPNIWRLNPFKNQWDPYNIAKGNPDLKPEFTDSYELSYILYWNKISVTPSAFFRQTHDLTSRYSYLSDSNITISTFRNLSSSKSYGIDIMTNSQIFSWWSLNGTLSMYRLELEGDNIDNFVSQKDFSWRVNLTAYFNFPKIINFQLFYNYSGKRINAQGETKAAQSLDFGINKSFFDNKLFVNLNISDILKLNSYDSDIRGTGFRQVYTSDYDSRVAYLTVSYMFGKQEQNKKKKRSTENNSTQEQNNQGDDGLK